jgi:hypothetical protein
LLFLSKRRYKRLNQMHSKTGSRWGDAIRVF